jgi:hypothetical protein
LKQKNKVKKLERIKAKQKGVSNQNEERNNQIGE